MPICTAPKTWLTIHVVCEPSIFCDLCVWCVNHQSFVTFACGVWIINLLWPLHVVCESSVFCDLCICCVNHQSFVTFACGVWVINLLWPLHVVCESSIFCDICSPWAGASKWLRRGDKTSHGFWISIMSLVYGTGHYLG